MAADEPFKRYEQAGAAFVDAAVNRLNGFFGRPSDAGEDADGGASGEDMAGGHRRARRERADQLIETIRSEIRSQLLQLGLATREELDALRSRLDDLESRLADREGPGGPDPDGTTS